jgi:hypothetical protein
VIQTAGTRFDNLCGGSQRHKLTGASSFKKNMIFSVQNRKIGINLN